MCSTILSPLYVAFGWILKLCCQLSGNIYVIGIVIFTILMQIVLFPLAIKQQKSSVMMGKIRPKEMLIREKYKGRNDKATQQKVTQEVQELYQKEGYNQFSGCLPLLIQLPIIIVLYAVIRSPLTYSMNHPEGVTVESQYEVAISIYNGAVDAIEEQYKNDYHESISESSEETTSTAEESTAVTDSSETEAEASEEAAKNALVSLKDAYKTSAETFNKYKTDTNYEFYLTSFIVYDYKSDIIRTLKENGVSEEIITKHITDDMTFNAEFVSEIPDFNLFGYSLIDMPKDHGFSWLLLIPLLVFVTSVLATSVTRKYNSVQTDPNAPGNGFLFKWGFPLLSTYFAWATFPAAVGVYWVIRTVLGIGQSFILAKMYPIPVVTAEDIAEIKKQIKMKKKKVITIEVDEDDDSYDSLIIKTGKKSPETNYKMLSEEDADAGKVEKAPLKKDDDEED